MLSRSHTIDIACPRCTAWLKFLVGIHTDGDDRGVYKSVAAELEGQSCRCDLTMKEIEEAEILAVSEYEEPERMGYRV